jgi:hypothetical protein
MSKKCTKPGCKSYGLHDDPEGLCFWHSQKTRDKRRQAGVKGGSRGKLHKAEVDINDIQGVKRLLVETINEVRNCNADSMVQKGRAVGYLASILLVALEKSDIEQRLARLEDALLTEHELV